LHLILRGQSGGVAENAVRFRMLTIGTHGEISGPGVDHLMRTVLHHGTTYGFRNFAPNPLPELTTYGENLIN
jgi:hypothetical protein